MQWPTGGEISEKVKKEKKELRIQCKPSGATEEKSLCHTRPQCLRRRDVNRKLHLWIANTDTVLSLPFLKNTLPYSHTCAQKNPTTSEKRFISAFFCAVLSPLMNNFCFSANQCYTWHSTALKEQHNEYDPIEHSSEAPAQQRAAHKSFLPCLMQFELSSVLCSVMPGGDTVEVGS